MIFTKIESVELPQTVSTGEGFSVLVEANGEMPFAQVIIRQPGGWEWIVRDDKVVHEGDGRYRIQVPPEAYRHGPAYLQIEGCRVADLGAAGANDWISLHLELQVKGDQSQNGASHHHQPAPEAVSFTQPSVTLERSTEPVIYFAIHKHMHQPYYNTTETDYWDGEKEAIFGQRGGPYTHFIPMAVRQYIHGGLAHAGLSCSWSGSLIEQLNRCAETGRGYGAFGNWKQELREFAQAKTGLGNRRIEFTLLGMFHPLMPLIPDRDIVGQLEWHKGLLRETFGVEASDILFPPETAFQPHMIPALNQAGVKVVLYDSIHHFRACQNYPYAGISEGMLPPNPADQVNPSVDDWLQLHNIWAPSKVSPQLLKPCILYYEDHQGKQHEIIGVPAERYLGNEDARGGYGALQYESVMGQIYDHICKTNTFDPDHPPLFVLHSDGDNYGGGTDSYYGHNTGRMVEMCRNDPRFQLVTIKDYLEKFPVDPNNKVHLEPGSWAGADNGDPQFTKWFSWADKDYSPDLNSWAVLTAFQNVVYTLEDGGADRQLVDRVKRLLYIAETSCYWYWTGQHVWDVQVTNAANKGVAMAQAKLHEIVDSNRDKTGPTIFVPWVRPANPGGKDWGQGCLVDAPPEALFRTFIYDASGVERVTLHYYNPDDGAEHQMPMDSAGPYPSHTSPTVIGSQYTAILPAGTGNIRYYVEAVDRQGNTSYSPVGRIYIA